MYQRRRPSYLVTITVMVVFGLNAEANVALDAMTGSRRTSLQQPQIRRAASDDCPEKPPYPLNDYRIAFARILSRT
jgi:hypothetical protein